LGAQAQGAPPAPGAASTVAPTPIAVATVEPQVELLITVR
jgi:hypothetical protein